LIADKADLTALVGARFIAPVIASIVALVAKINGVV
jgi:hypothetical protein